MVKKEEASYEVGEIATQTTKVILKGEEQVGIEDLLSQVANDLANIKKDLAEVLEKLK